MISISNAFDLTQSTRRINPAQGFTALATGVSLGLSNVISGSTVQYFGSIAGFLGLAGLAALALANFSFFMLDTSD